MPFLGGELNLCSAATHSQKISAASAIVYFICKVRTLVHFLFKVTVVYFLYKKGHNSVFPL